MAKNSKKDKKKDNNKHYFKDFKAELKKVVWPTPKQLVNSTAAVITIVLITALIVLVLDLAFENMNKHGIDRIRNSVVNTTNETTQNTTAEDSTGENQSGEQAQNNTENAEAQENQETNTENAEANTVQQ